MDFTPTSPLAERYWQSQWAEFRADGLGRFLAECPDLNGAQLLEVLLVDQALAWRRSPGPSVEDYLRRFPAIARERPAVLELVAGEMRAARSLDLPGDVEWYVARFPDLAEPLRRQQEVSVWLARSRTAADNG